MNETVEVQELTNGDLLVTVTHRYRRFWLFGRVVVEKAQYRGNCTVWHEYPSGKRCGTLTECWLSDVWEKHQWTKEQRT